VRRLKNAIVIVLRSGCEQQRHTHLDNKTWQPQHQVS